MNQSPRPYAALNVLVAVAAFIVLIAGLKAAKGILIPFVFALFLAILGAAPLAFLNKKLPSIVSVLVVAASVVLLFSAIAAFLVSSVNEFTDGIPLYKDRIGQLFLQLQIWLESKGLERSSLVFSSSIDPGHLIDGLASFLRGLVNALSRTLLVFIFMVFMLVEAAEFREKLQAVLEVHKGTFDMSRFTEVSADVQRYLAMKTVTSGVTGLLAGSMVALLGLDYALLWGILAFLLNYIPFVGSFVAAIPAVMLAILQLGLVPATIMAVLYIVINVGVSNFFEPILMGRRLGLSPLIVFLSLIFWGWVWGPAGMLLSVPLTMMAKILLEHSREFQWIAILMDSRPGKLAIRQTT
jgi:predicted PurR-regulated permease PerM